MALSLKFVRILNFLSCRHIFPSYDIRHSNIHHSNHPTFRKRSAISENTKATNTKGTSDDIFHWKLHRTTRYKLYEHLEKFIDT